MRSFVIVQVKIVTQTDIEAEDGLVFFDVDVLVFDRAPQPLDEDVVKDAAAAVHADLDAGCLQLVGEVAGSKLAACLVSELVGQIRVEKQERIRHGLQLALEDNHGQEISKKSSSKQRGRRREDHAQYSPQNPQTLFQ